MQLLFPACTPISYFLKRKYTRQKRKPDEYKQALTACRRRGTVDRTCWLALLFQCPHLRLLLWQLSTGGRPLRKLSCQTVEIRVDGTTGGVNRHETSRPGENRLSATHFKTHSCGRPWHRRMKGCLPKFNTNAPFTSSKAVNYIARNREMHIYLYVVPNFFAFKEFPQPCIFACFHSPTLPLALQTTILRRRCLRVSPHPAALALFPAVLPETRNPLGPELPSRTWIMMPTDTRSFVLL